KSSNPASPPSPRHNITRCFLEDKSPSCGVGCGAQFSQETNAYKNSKYFTGVTTALLIRKGYIVEEVVT
ncbi:MAG: hypothetical protein KAT52_08260, partial [Desulfobacterales bacterium]|nr:hypothetical protein [Desulfobacterales bacterium]